MSNKPTNCHTHIFTIEHVPKYIGKKMLPSIVLAYLFNINVLKKAYNFFSFRKNEKLQLYKYVVIPKIIGFLKVTKLLYWIFLIVKGVLKIFWRFFTASLRFIFFNFFGIRSLEGIKRYFSLARHATYSSQLKVFEVLQKAYPDDFSFIVLPMDMEFMNAGKPKLDYYNQLSELLEIKKSNLAILPFIAVDPRRIQYPKKENFNFENYVVENLSNTNFSGVKLYPALGYYPFDKRLKNTYQFCVDNNIPLISHCIEGTIYYRGSKEKEEVVEINDKKGSLNNKKEWKEHPILKVNKQTVPLQLPQKQNHDFTKNFSHPLNYKCLLDPAKVSEYYGENVDFSGLKICLAHFGGSEEWQVYFNDIYETYNNNLFKDENIGKSTAYSNTQKIWDSASWLCIIYDLMCEYKNVYADMSFMLYNERNFDLLKLLIDDKRVGHKILFGTDFYVVAQKATEKTLYHTIKSRLGEERFNKVAIKNNNVFLKSNFS